MIIQFVGYSNSGKTTMLEKTISYFAAKGLSVATIKHHGHSEELQSLDEGKDSWRHRQAGAMATSVCAGPNFQFQSTKQINWTLADILSIYQQIPYDVLFVEGFKKEKYDKIVFIQKEEDMSLLDNVENCCAVVYWDTVQKEMIYKGPVFSICEEELFLEWLYSFYKHSL
ncbi:molybdopterin-guanine dinucleotide biosynthesis protein B [Alkalihalobacterium bogoriense]|uniref:molybdopterin-guanine dinucleotide biosynthesis protein B n=1 Tax=Alkalihalobacterium bogoriense TaxID=246272 RepID=UPI000684D14E|nr:molybdopterin-guanine dinucleotide biosynthesis protein B [Alkalihalobacterium bogoriense]